MGEELAAASVQFLVQNLISMLASEIKLVRGFEDDLEKLREALSTAQEFLTDAEEKEIKDDAAKKWLKKLERVAMEADAILDEFNYQLQKKTQREKQETGKKVSCSLSSASSSFLFRRKMAHEINDLNKKLENTNNVALSNGYKKRIESAPRAMETNSYFVESKVIGRENDITYVVNLALSASLAEKISVIPIVGMGGLGKTTLARQIFHDGNIVTHFEKQIWVCVSTKFDELTLFQVILNTLTGKDVQGIVSKEIVLQNINEKLKNKRYLLVLDDVWNDNFTKWENFMAHLRGISNVNQNVIIVTTRKKNVASLVGTLPTHALMGLSQDDCWSIIKTQVLLSKEDQLELETVGQQIAEKCCGLPLAASVVGGVLRDKQKDEWSLLLTNQLSSFGQDVDDNRIMKILKLSYNQLPTAQLKKCFAYCSIFPQDFDIKKKILIRQWLAEGCLETSQDNNHLETTGNTFFNCLLQSSLIQESRRNKFGEITHCRMHDLVHDLACLVSGHKSTEFVKDSVNDIKVRYLYLNSHHISKERVKYVRALIFKGEVIDNMFADFSFLHTLTLNSSIDELPVEIEKQVNLKFLDISRTRITNLPDSINKLSNLQTLVVKKLQKLPNTISGLLNLRHLHISSIELPPFIGNLTLLQSLPYYKVGHDEGCKISELRNLKNLKGKITIQNLERVKDKAEAEQADLFGNRTF